MRFSAEEEGGRFAVGFAAKLHLHYSTLERENEGLVITIQFGGEAFADSPTPQIQELFYAAVVESLFVYGYGSQWKGETTPTPKELAQNLGVVRTAY